MPDADTPALPGLEVPDESTTTPSQATESSVNTDQAATNQAATNQAATNQAATNQAATNDDASGTTRPTDGSVGAADTRKARARPARPAAAPPPDGAELERRVARLEFAEGALVRLRVPVHVDAEAGRDILTDLDVLAIDIDGRLRTSRSTLECKSGKGQSGEGDRLLWLAGLKTLTGVDRAVLVRQTITRRGRHIAARLGVRILDVPTLTAREAAHAWLPERFAHVDGPACVAAEARTDIQLKGLGHLPSDLIAYLRSRSLLEPSYRALSALSALRSRVEDGGVLPQPTRTVIASHALQALTLAAIADAALLDTMSTDELRRRVQLALTVGTPDDDHVLDVLGLADTVVARLVDSLHRTYTAGGAERLSVDLPRLRDLVAAPPDWIDRYVDLVQTLRANPAIARDLPRAVELACFDGLLGDSAYLNRAFDHLFTAEHRHLLLAVVRCLRDVSGGQIADAVSPAADLNFERTAPALPDRSSPN